MAVYRACHPGYCALVRRIAATARLIDLIVYRLYGLKEEEGQVAPGARQGRARAVLRRSRKPAGTQRELVEGSS